MDDIHITGAGAAAILALWAYVMKDVRARKVELDACRAEHRVRDKEWAALCKRLGELEGIVETSIASQKRLNGFCLEVLDAVDAK